MAQVRWVDLDGQEFDVPERIIGDSGPEIEITICETGEFINPDVETLAFMPRPEPPAIERLQLGVDRTMAGVVAMGEKWEVTEEELQMAREEAAEMSSIPGVTKKRLREVIREVWGW